MNFDDTKINELIEKEIAKQINKKLDSAIERIVTREVNKALVQSEIIDRTAMELIKTDKDFRRRVGVSCARELYENLVREQEDNYYN
jgi:RecJ-like exonuclease